MFYKLLALLLFSIHSISDAGATAVYIHTYLLSRIAHVLTDEDKPSKVCTCASLLSMLIKALLVSRREFSELMAFT